MLTSNLDIRVIRYQTKKGVTRQVTVPAPKFEVTDDYIRLFFTGLPPGLNQKHGKHWAKTYVDKEYWKQYARITAEECGARVTGAKARLHWLIYLIDHRVRDEDNLRGGMKPVQDGLVEGGVITGDSIWDIETAYSFEIQPPLSFVITITSL